MQSVIKDSVTSIIKVRIYIITYIFLIIFTFFNYRILYISNLNYFFNVYLLMNDNFE